VLDCVDSFLSHSAGTSMLRLSHAKLGFYVMWSRLRQVFARKWSDTPSWGRGIPLRGPTLFHPAAALGTTATVVAVRAIPYTPVIVSALMAATYPAYLSGHAGTAQPDLPEEILQAVAWRHVTPSPYGDYVAATARLSAAQPLALDERTARPVDGAESGGNGSVASSAPSAADRQVPSNAITANRASGGTHDRSSSASADGAILTGPLGPRFVAALLEAGIRRPSIDEAIAAFPAVDMRRPARPGGQFRALIGPAKGEPADTPRILAIEVRTNNGGVRRAIRYRPPGTRNAAFYAPDGRSLQPGIGTDPVTRSRLSSRFGARVHPISGARSFHTGVDFAAPYGTPVRVTARGSVTFVGTQQGYGRTVIVRHANGYETVYAHLSSAAHKLQRGARVRRGDVIGYVGATGWATGPHLHYEVRHRNRPVDPFVASTARWPALRGATLRAFEQYSANLSMDDDTGASVSVASRP
jgi:murein DD-endopeptidase MepM/ murein hydrolase activator NlpD